MSCILDVYPYPFQDPVAQRLHLVLSQLHPSPDGAVLVAEQAGVSRGMIFANQTPYLLWAAILREAANSGLTRDLVQVVHDLLDPRSPHRPFLASLLRCEPTPAEAEPRGADGRPLFLRDSDEVTRPEALLYHDDLTIQTGRLPALIRTLERLLELSRSICHLVVDFQGTTRQGTAVRVGEDLLLTNWHVLHDVRTGAPASAVSAEFGFEVDADGHALAPSVVRCDVGSIVTSRADDWAVVRAASALDPSWPVVKLSEAVAPVEGSASYIIQHPAGGRKRLGFVRNTVTDFDERTVHYLTDTQEGSSGAPVFDAQGLLIALHHAGGRPQQVVGKPPLKKNEGIRIARIVSGLAERGVSVP
jgi:hypothetical protein